MSSLAEIQEAIEKLTSEERARLREWFDGQDAGPLKPLAFRAMGTFISSERYQPIPNL
jgi:hypothetical protein